MISVSAIESARGCVKIISSRGTLFTFRADMIGSMSLGEPARATGDYIKCCLVNGKEQADKMLPVKTYSLVLTSPTNQQLMEIFVTDDMYTEVYEFVENFFVKIE